MKVVKIEMSGRSKPMWAIELVPQKGLNQAVMYGAYRDKHGFIRYSGWTRKKDAVKHLKTLTSYK